MNTDPRSDDELHLIVLKWLGWTNLKSAKRGVLYGSGPGQPLNTRQKTVRFCQDREACARFEGRLTDEQHLQYRNAVKDRVRGNLPSTPREGWDASARQRVEALVELIEAGRL